MHKEIGQDSKMQYAINLSLLVVGLVVVILLAFFTSWLRSQFGVQGSEFSWPVFAIQFPFLILGVTFIVASYTRMFSGMIRRLRYSASRLYAPDRDTE